MFLEVESYRQSVRRYLRPSGRLSVRWALLLRKAHRDRIASAQGRADKNRHIKELATSQQFPQEYFDREDQSDDSIFYSFPRLLVHIDDQAIEAVGRVFLDLVPPGSAILDLMSSWRSHWPKGHPKARMVGLGLKLRGDGQ